MDDGAMDGMQYLKLVGDTRAFKQSAELVEHEIHRLNAKPGDISPIDGKAGWPSHHVWESLKTVSHFNLAIALELRLKCLMQLHDIDHKNSHLLSKLFSLLRKFRPCTATQLQDLFQQAIVNHALSIQAYISTTDNSVPEGPSNRDLNTLEEFFEYMDEDVELWKKRYSWEKVTDNQWRHYLDNLNAFFEFLDTTETLAAKLAQEKGFIK